MSATAPFGRLAAALLLVATLLATSLFATAAQAEDDARMLVSITAGEEQGMSVQQLHTDIRQAAELALPVMWHRILSEASIAELPDNIKAIRFLQKATPTETGVDILFSHDRVYAFLKQQGITAFGDTPAETTATMPTTPGTDGAAAPVPLTSHNYLTLSVERHASLPDQVLFEEDLRRDPRILELSLKQVNRDGQKYRVLLAGSDDQWMATWFLRHGLTLTPTIEGWVAHAR